MAHPPPPVIGELVVVALKAENLQHQAPGKQDPFCIFRVGEVVKRTKTDYGGGQYPIWDDQVNIPIPAGYHQMQVSIFDKDTKPINLMGEGVVDLTKVLREKEHDGYFPITLRGRQNCGEIYLELTFYGAQNAARPQQQVRYQYPPGYIPGGNAGGYRPPPPGPQQHRPPPPMQQQPHMHPQQSRPPLQMQHPPPPQQQHRPPPPQMHQQQHRPPPPQMQQQHRPPPVQHHNTMPPAPHHSPYPQPRPSNSIGTAQHYSPVMPSPQPLLSAPYQPTPSPATRPAHLNYPPQNHHQGTPYSPSYPPQQGGGPPGGFHDPNRAPYPPPQHQQHQQQPPGMRPMNHPPPPPPGGYRPSNNNYPPY